MELNNIVSHIKHYEGVRRKSIISQMCSFLPPRPEFVLASFGEDCAVLKYRKSEVLLLACDSIIESLINRDPYWAGYCSVLVNVNDIAAMGGKPIAMVNAISGNNKKIMSQIMRGMSAAIKKFDVPMVGGHTHPDAKSNNISVSILGVVKLNDVLYSHTAKIGDSIVIAYDLEGKFTPNITYSWDTTSFKSSFEVRQKIETMQIIAKKHFVTAAKDISMPGTLGTLGMLLESSRKGAEVDINSIPVPNKIPLIRWLCAYQGCGFVLTCSKKDTNKLIVILEHAGLTAACVGIITNNNKLIIKQGHKRSILFDFKKEIIT